MATIYGYARCSTNELRQDITRQIRELKKLGVPNDKNIYFEYESGAKANRVELQKILDKINCGDTLVCTEVSRLSRSTKQLCEILQLVQDRHLRLIIGSFIIDCREADIEATTKGMLLMWAVFSEMERDIIKQRVRSGMENAKAKGKRLGRPELELSNLPAKFLQFYPEYKSGRMKATDLSRVVGRSRTTIYKYVSFMEKS